MLEEVEELRVACEGIGYCGFYLKIISQTERWKYCHHNNCPKNKNIEDKVELSSAHQSLFEQASNWILNDIVFDSSL